MHPRFHAHRMGNSSGESSSLFLAHGHINSGELISVIITPFVCVSDCTGSEAGDPNRGFLGIDSDTCSRVRDHHGFASLHPGRLLGLVPICVGIPNSHALQPSLQQRFADFPYSRRTEERPVLSKQGVKLKESPSLTCIIIIITLDRLFIICHFKC